MINNILSKNGEPLFHITKRTNIRVWKVWLIRLIAVGLSLLVCGIISASLNDVPIGVFFEEIFEGVFGTKRRIWKLLQNVATLLIISLALVPAFKMKFWNIGAEGQTLMSALFCTLVVMQLGDQLSNDAILVVMLLAGIFGGAVWAVIPAIFKAKWNTNETLFTLMMNYIATCLVAFSINLWATDGSATMGILKNGAFPKIGGYEYLLNVIIVLLVTLLLTIYMVYSKHGYELSVVGESMNTAKYIGINTKKVIIRTMILSGVICGIAGWIIVAGSAHTLTTEVVDGRGFTGILVAWLAQLSPVRMIMMSTFVEFLSQGSAHFAMIHYLGEYYPDIMTGVFFIIFICFEFFINYKINIRPIFKKHKEVVA